MGKQDGGVPELLTVRRCLLLAGLATVVGVTLRLAKPVDPPDPAFLERVESWNRLAAELLAGHHLERRKQDRFRHIGTVLPVATFVLNRANQVGNPVRLAAKLKTRSDFRDAPAVALIGLCVGTAASVLVAMLA